MAHSTSFDPNIKSIPAFVAVESDTVQLENLSTKEQQVIQDTTKIAAKAIAETEISTGESIQKPVYVEEKSPEITQIAINAGVIDQTDPLEKMEELKQRCKVELDTAKLNCDKPRVNYLTQMSQLIAEISTLLSQWTSRDNARIEAKKNEYSTASTAIEYNHYTKGGWNLALGVVGAGLACWSPNASLGPLQQSMNNFLDGQGTKPNQESQLTLQSIQKLNESLSSNNDLREKALQALEAIKQWALTAARHG